MTFDTKTIASIIIEYKDSPLGMPGLIIVRSFTELFSTSNYFKQYSTKATKMGNQKSDDYFSIIAEK